MENIQETKEELAARRTAIDAVVQRLDQLAQERNLPEAVVNDIRAGYTERLNRAEGNCANGLDEFSLSQMAQHFS